MITYLVVFLKSIFGLGRWYKVFPSTEIAFQIISNKKAILVEVDNVEICLSRNGDALFAFVNNCPHNHMPMHKGKFNENGEWVCPYHRHCFDMKNGANITMPSTENAQLLNVKSTSKGVFVFK